MSEEVWEVWGAYHERERLCPEGVRVGEIAHVHYDHDFYHSSCTKKIFRAIFKPKLPP